MPFCPVLFGFSYEVSDPKKGSLVILWLLGYQDHMLRGFTILEGSWLPISRVISALNKVSAILALLMTLYVLLTQPYISQPRKTAPNVFGGTMSQTPQ